ncbi:MAG: hypothetical protein M3043_09890 [Lysinibacillus fusiformis]|nr:hypothetical protein [Lysinibacillus fusiformis]MCT6927436.1 hypothetical protein [Lysinibacillus fusiformis]MCT6931772.1 hypothetical protein [Lysinibacillus fusiformis]
MDFWSFIDKNFTNIIVPLGTICGAILGGVISSKTQKSVFLMQKEKDEQNTKYIQSKETLEIYNKVLEMHGTAYIIEHNSGFLTEFLIDEYLDKVRPLLYERFHQLHQNVADKVIELDEIIEMCNFNDDVSDQDSEMLANFYTVMIENIKLHLKDYRNNYIN